MEYITVADALGIHAVLLKRYGGAAGLRDIGALDSALFRPQTGYYQDLIQQAAALWESLAQNHPFVDGNKRTAFACIYTFLKLNGKTIVADALDVYNFIIGLYKNNNFEFKILEEWLRNYYE